MSTQSRRHLPNLFWLDIPKHASLALQDLRRWRDVTRGWSPLRKNELTSGSQSLGHLMDLRYRVGVNGEADLEGLKAEYPDLHAALEGIKAAARKGWETIQQPDREAWEWGWFDDLERAIESLDALIEGRSADTYGYITPKECMTLARGRGKSLAASTITSNKKSFDFISVNGNLFVEPKSFLAWLKTYDPRPKAPRRPRAKE